MWLTLIYHLKNLNYEPYTENRKLFAINIIALIQGNGQFDLKWCGKAWEGICMRHLKEHFFIH